MSGILSQWVDRDFLGHILPPFALHLDLGSSVQYSHVGLCLYLRLLSDEGSMVIFKIVISLTMGICSFDCVEI